MKNIKFSRLFAAMMFVAVLSFAGCKQQPEEEKASIYGTWVCADGQKFIITDSELKNYWGESDGYAGDNLVVVELSETTGTIFIKYTKAFCSVHSDYNNYIYTYDEDAPDVGKWYAVSYKDLTKETVQLAGSAGTPSGTLELAKAEHTIEKQCFGTYDKFTRQ